MIILPILFQAALLAGEPAPVEMTAPIAPVSVADLHNQFIESVEDANKAKVLTTLSRTPPEDTRDVQSLFDLFMRFSDMRVRDAVLSSLQLLNLHSPDLDVLFVHYLQQPEPEARIFAIKGAVRVRDANALPLIEKIARNRFTYKSANDATLLSEKNEWWVQYEALEALAQWKQEIAMEMLVKKSREAPEIARVMGRFLWKKSLPEFIKWAGSSSQNDQDRAHAGLTAPAPNLDLRETRLEMLAILRDPKAPREARHQLAIKIGLCSTHEEIEQLFKEYSSQKDDEGKLMFKAALFASRDKLVVPLLTQTLKEDPNDRNRAGALIELEDILAPSELRPLLEWVSKNDPDTDNRDLASHELKTLPR
ncbi:MAG: hypothetical protein HY077_15150 [Elusimicrobia bacterium]|nr:hypothetical protein [Elusimicrobiota bacterium]